MKKILITLISIFVLSTAYAQSSATVSMCKETVKTEDAKTNTASISLETLLKCNQLTSNNQHDYIQSFDFSIKTNNTTVHEIKTEGNKLTEKMIALIKQHKPEKIYIENIVVVNAGGEGISSKPLILTIK